MVKVEMELPELPIGFYYTGEYRPLQPDDLYLTSENKVRSATGTSLSAYPVVRKDKTYRSPVMQDLINGAIKCEYRMTPHSMWIQGWLYAIDAARVTDPRSVLPYWVGRGDGGGEWVHDCRLEAAE